MSEPITHVDTYNYTNLSPTRMTNYVIMTNPFLQCKCCTPSNNKQWSETIKEVRNAVAGAM